MIQRQTIDLVREKTDIVELLESKGVSLKRTGSRYVGLCPVHNERSPSFNVNPDTQSFYCFGCGFKGDAIALMRELDGYSFTGAVEYLAELVGVHIENTEGEDPDYQRKKDYMSCVGAAAWFYRQKFAELPENHPAKANLAGRHYLRVEGRETWLEDFGMGYAPDGWDNLSKFLMHKGFTVQQMEDAGLIYVNEKSGKPTDRFRNRLLWEIRTIQGKPIGFSGRRLNEADNPKYLNTSNTVMYNKSKVLYGLDLARKKMADDKTCFVVEGAADVMALSAVGATNTVASCGTSFGAEHSAIIKRIIDDFDAQKKGKFVFVFDGDAAGVKAAMRIYDINPPIYERSYVVSLGEGDPVDVRVAKGDAFVMDALMTKQVPLTEFVINQKLKDHNLDTAEGRQNFINEALELINPIREVAIYESYKRKIAFLAGVPLEFIQRRKTVAKPAMETLDDFSDPFSNITYSDPVEPVSPPAPETHSAPFGGEQPFTDEPPMDPYEYQGELPPDDYNPYADGVPSRPQVQEQQAEFAQPVARPLTMEEKVERKMIAALIQYPTEVFPFLADKAGVLDVITNEKHKRILQEAMGLIGGSWSEGSKARVIPADFSDENFIHEMIHSNIHTDAQRVVAYVQRSMDSLHKMSVKRHNNELRLKAARNLSTQSMSEMDLLAAMVKNRKK